MLRSVCITRSHVRHIPELQDSGLCKFLSSLGDCFHGTFRVQAGHAHSRDQYFKRHNKRFT